MKILNEHDYVLLKNLLSFNQKQTKSFSAGFLSSYYLDVVETDSYIIAEGNIPIALVAHMDTVFEGDGNDRSSIYQYMNGTLWHPKGAGFDDKAGIFSIFKILEDGYLPHVILTTDEEIGSLGARRLVQDLPNPPFNDLRYLICLDRADAYDCVFYECEDKKFIDYIQSFGFVESFGTSSDIKHICPVWNVAGTNLSVGYQNKHSENETLDITMMFETISKVKEMLDDIENVDVSFKYIASTLK